MRVEAAWQVTVTRRDGSVHRYTERRCRHPEIGEVLSAVYTVALNSPSGLVSTLDNFAAAFTTMLTCSAPGVMTTPLCSAPSI